MGYIVRPQGYGFSAILVIDGVSILAILPPFKSQVINRVRKIADFFQKIGYGKSQILVINRVTVLESGPHTPTKCFGSMDPDQASSTFNCSKPYHRERGLDASKKRKTSGAGKRKNYFLSLASPTRYPHHAVSRLLYARIVLRNCLSKRMSTRAITQSTGTFDISLSLNY